MLRHCIGVALACQAMHIAGKICVLMVYAGCHMDSFSHSGDVVFLAGQKLRCCTLLLPLAPRVPISPAEDPTEFACRQLCELIGARFTVETFQDDPVAAFSFKTDTFFHG